MVNNWSAVIKMNGGRKHTRGETHAKKHTAIRNASMVSVLSLLVTE